MREVCFLRSHGQVEAELGFPCSSHFAQESMPYSAPSPWDPAKGLD